MNKFLLDFKDCVTSNPNITFAHFCRTRNYDYQATRSWLFRYKGLSILELKTGVLKKSEGVTYKMKGRDKHKDVISKPEGEPIDLSPQTLSPPDKEVIGEVVFELRKYGIRTILKDIPVRHFNVILASIISKYGEPENIKEKRRKKTS